MKLKSFIIVAMVLLMPLGLFSQTYKELWKQVENAQNKDLPKTVISHLEKIEKKAQAEKAYGQLMRSTLLHAQLLASPKFPFYNSEYYKVLPFIVELRNRGADKDENEVETCFNSLYGVMMLRLQKKEITPNTQAAVKEITTFIGMLNDYYLKDKQEPLEFE